VEELMTTRVEKLREIPLFAECSDESLRRIAELATEFDAEPGHVLAQWNQPGTGLFILEEGTVVAELSGRRVNLGPGEFFGELALLDERAVHTGRVRAVEHIRALAIRRDDFHKLLESEPTMAITMLRVVARRLASMLHG
jgi:CRP-like cAMP-binding protein